MTKKRKYLIILIVAIVMFIVVLIIRNVLMSKNTKPKQFNTLDDFTTPKEVIEYMGDTYITEEKSTDEKYVLDIYVKFNTDLYTGETSNEEHYRKLVRIMAYTLDFDSFRIADEEKKTLIAVVCDKENSSISRTYINGDDNYFATKDSEIKANKMEKTKITELKPQAPELLKLINNNWSKDTFNVVQPEETDAYTILGNGIILRNVYKQVFNIVFKNSYSNEVLNGINPSMKLEEIVKILGEPTFGSIEENLIGYKGTEIYAFFGNKFISIYKVEDYENDKLVDILKDFQEERDVKKFVSAITDMWPDYDKYTYDTKFVDLKYSLKGVKVQFNISTTHGLVIGNNYKGNIEELKKLKEELGIIELYFENIDFVYETELERLNNARG